MSNPIIQREFVGLLRSRRALWVQLAVVLGLTLLVLLRWPGDARADYNGRQAQQVMELFGYGALLAVIFLTPVFPAVAIVRERQRGTLALLLNSPMSPGSILLGKLAGQLGFALLLLTLSLPAGAACYAMGGVGAGEFVKVYAVLGLAAVQCAAAGLLVSGYAGSIESALRLTYAGVLGLAVLPMAPYQLVQGVAAAPADLRWAADWFRCLSPVPAMMQVLGHAGVGSMGLSDGGDLVGCYAVIASLTAGVMLCLTSGRLGQKMLDRPRASGRVTDDRPAGVRVYRRLMYLWFFDPQRRSGLIAPWMNPVLVKEFRCRRFGRANWVMRLLAGCLILAMGLMLVSGWASVNWGPATMGGLMVAVQGSLVILLTPSLAGGLISSERETGGWELMQMTPLSAGRIVRGKLLSAIWTLVLVLLATLPAYAVLLYIEPGQMTVVLQVLASLLATAGFAVLLSAAISSLSRHTATATAAAYVVLILLCGGTMLFWLGRDNPFSHDLVERVLTVNPLAATMTVVGAPGFADYKLIPGDWWFLGCASAACLAVLSVRTWQLTRPR